MSERIKYVLTAFWPEGQNTEIVASECQAGVAPFTREQTFPDPSQENITQHYSQPIMQYLTDNVLTRPHVTRVTTERAARSTKPCYSLQKAGAACATW